MTTPANWQAVNELFAELAELDPAARRRALAAWPGDPQVRREVESLLAALDSPRVDLEPSPGASHLTLGGEAAVIVMSLAGRRLGPWAVVREVGRGGMGAVYEAFRADDQYKKRVAVKTITRGVDSAVVARRFQQERQILASLEHPNIATLIDGGVTEEGLPYLVMEFVDGEPIDRYCASHRLPLRERLDLIRQVASAIQYAHRNLVVHRDIKPSNVLVTSDGVVKLVDFGIAKLIGGQPADEPSITETGLRAFTTSYASPEQVRGEPISTSSDVYSLGALLYLVLAGRLPFEVGRLTTAEALRVIAEETAPPPSRVCTEQVAKEMGYPTRERLARELTGELDDIVLVALRKEPERRYSTVAGLSEDLKRYLQGQQVSARPDTWRYRISSFTRRNPRLVTLGVLAALSLAGGAALASWQARRAGVERDRARTEATRSSRVVSFIEQTLASPVQGALTDATVQMLDQAVSRASVELADDPLARAAVYRTAANAYTFHYRDELATPLLDSALALDRAHAGAESAEMGRDLTVAARLLFNRGMLDSAVTSATTAVRLLRTYPSDRPVDLATALLYQSFALTYAGRAAEGKRVAEEGVALENTRPGSTLLPYLQMAVGESAYFLGDLTSGESQYRLALQLYDALPVPDPPERGIGELGLSTILVIRSALPEGEQHLRRAIEILERRWGTDHAYTARAHAAMARLMLQRGDSTGAAREMATALKVLESRRLSLVDEITIEVEYARYCRTIGEVDRIVPRLQDVLRRRGAELARSPQLLATAQQVLGEALTTLHRPDAALPVLVSSYDLRAATYGADHEITRYTALRALFAAAAARNDSAISRFSRMMPADTARKIRAQAEAWEHRGPP